MLDLQDIYKKLHKAQGDQSWWPGDSPFEVMIGAILTQNTSWTNVEKAIKNLKTAGALSLQGIKTIPIEQLAELIRPSGYYNQKSKKLKRFVEFVVDNYEGEVDLMKSSGLHTLREELIGINGIGPETADSILLYAFHFPIFVIDAYTARLVSRLELLEEPYDYHQLQEFFTDHLPEDVELFNDFHAQIVMHGKDTCKKRKPLCEACPLNDICPYPTNSHPEHFSSS